jgi:hypothetical protein
MPKISGLPQDTSPTTDDYIVTLDSTSGTDKKVLLSSLSGLFNVKRTSTITSSASPTPNADTTDDYTITTLATGATFGQPSGTPVNGQVLVIRVKDNGSAQSLAWNSSYRAIGVTLPTATVGGKTYYIGMKYNSSDVTWDVISVARQS